MNELEQIRRQMQALCETINYHNKRYYENDEPLMFDIQVENPPYFAKFDQSPELLDDHR